MAASKLLFVMVFSFIGSRPLRFEACKWSFWKAVVRGGLVFPQSHSFRDSYRSCSSSFLATADLFLPLESCWWSCSLPLYSLFSGRNRPSVAVVLLSAPYFWTDRNRCCRSSMRVWAGLVSC